MKLCRTSCWFAVALTLPSLAAAELSISGIDGELERNVRAFTALASESCDAEDWRIRRRFRSLEKEATRALEPFGYYDPVITSSLTLGDDCWKATLNVVPGEQVLLRDINIDVRGEAADDPPFAVLVAAAELKPGSPLRHSEYERVKKSLQTLAADRGYFDASFSDSRIDVWPNEGRADVRILLDSGPRYRLGEISITQDILNDNIPEAYIDLRQGEYYDSDKLARAFRELTDSVYFSSINIFPDVEDASDGSVPIRINLEPGTRIEYGAGVGYSTDIGARLRTGFRNNRLNRKGHRIVLDVNIAELIQGATAEYRIPLGDPRREWFSITSGLSTEQTETYDSDIQSFGARWTRIMSDRWLRTFALDVKNESYDLGNVVRTARSVVPAVIFDHKSSDTDVFPTRGHRYTAELRGTDKTLGSNSSFVQTVLRARWVRGLGENYRVLARLNAGFTDTPNFNDLPPSVRFFAGGDESIRGFDFESLGPKNEDGLVVGGSNLLVASLELERRLKGNYYGAVFVDAGNAFNDNDFEPEVGAGIGIKWRSPVGAIRLYLGYPVSDSEKSLRLHLRLGADL
ncbi:MAG: autotransporter assembly complex family protein [Woeseiaceae bacterium]|nr:autotransporter assembly complex family protein [Woeseiaceae bacterium]